MPWSGRKGRQGDKDCLLRRRRRGRERGKMKRREQWKLPRSKTLVHILVCGFLYVQ